MLLLPGHMQELLLFDRLWLRRLFRFGVLFFNHHVLVSRILSLDFFDVVQVDSVVIVLLRVWTHVRLKPSIRISYLSVDCLSILEHHGNVDLLIILQPLIESSLQQSFMHRKCLMMWIFSLARMHCVFVHHHVKSIYMSDSILMILHVPWETMARLMVRIMFLRLIMLREFLLFLHTIGRLGLT